MRYVGTVQITEAGRLRLPRGALASLVFPTGRPQLAVFLRDRGVFRKLWGQTLFGPRSEHLLRNAVLALLETPGTTLLGLIRLLVDEDYRLRIVARGRRPSSRITRRSGIGR